MSIPTPQVGLKVGGQVFSGWKRLRISRGIEQLAGRYDLTAIDRWALGGTELPPRPGQLAKLAMNGITIISGFIDDTNVDYDSEDHLLVISGRDFTGDLVDCSAFTDGQSWIGRNLEQLARELCEPFGIAVRINGDPGLPFPVQAISGGETIFEVLSRAAAMRGYLLVSDGNGGLLITQAGTGRAKTPLIQGKNLMRVRTVNSHRNRFHEYQVVGQGLEHEAAPGAEPLLQQALARSYDSNIRKARVTRMVAGDAVTASEAQQIANWVMPNRAARGVRFELQVQGWLDDTTPWTPNTEVYVESPYGRIKGWYLICHVQSDLDEKAGDISIVTVTPKAAFVPQPTFRFDGISYIESQAAAP